MSFSADRAPEFALVAACCIWPPSERRTAAIRAAAAGGNIAWQRFVQIVRRHRVYAQVHEGLNQSGIALPEDIASQLRTLALESARQNMRFAQESLRLQEMFDAQDVDLLFVKGVSLAQFAYGSLGIKHSWDIDMVVAPGSVSKAIALLTLAGYRGLPPLPLQSDRRYARWLRYGREYVLVHPASGIHLEIHWRLVDNNYFLPGISAASPSRSVALAGKSALRTLQYRELVAYLSVHGAIHGWSRVKWLADFAALIANEDERGLEQLLSYAKTVNAQICLAQALLLCDSLFATPGLASLAQTLRRSWRHRCLERAALAVILRGDGLREPDAVPFGMLPIYGAHFLLGRGVRFLAAELWNKLNAPYDLLYSTLPPWLGFLYAPLRIFAWLARRGHIRPLPASPAVTDD